MIEVCRDTLLFSMCVGTHQESFKLISAGDFVCLLQTNLPVSFNGKNERLFEVAALG